MPAAVSGSNTGARTSTMLVVAWLTAADALSPAYATSTVASTTRPSSSEPLLLSGTNQAAAAAVVQVPMPDTDPGDPHATVIVAVASSSVSPSSDKWRDTDSPSVITRVRPTLSCNWYDSCTVVLSWYTRGVFSITSMRVAGSSRVVPGAPPAAPTRLAPNVAWNANELPGAAPDKSPKRRVNDEVLDTIPRSLSSGNAKPLYVVISGLASARYGDGSKRPSSVVVQADHSVGSGDGSGEGSGVGGSVGSCVGINVGDGDGRRVG